jgi:2-alkenal reductase
VPTPGIGILVADEAVASRFGIEGVVVARTLPDSPAERAGLEGADGRLGELGDVIVAADGRPVRRLADLAAALERAGVGQPVELTVEREGQTRAVRVEVADVGRTRR